jgi:Uncharacterised protein conserved in bacteria (DUF2336)
MTMQQTQALLEELELGLVDRPSSRRFTILRQLTDLFLEGAGSYSEDSIHLFDELMGSLVDRIERQAVIELSQKLAPVEQAPPAIIGRLSQHDDIAIAEPVLTQSPLLSEQDLVHIAQTKSQDHLHAIARRAELTAPVTDVLVDRGNAKVTEKVVSNAGARFSRWGLTQAVERAKRDENVAAAIASRADVPPDLFDELVRKATQVVRRRLMMASSPEKQERITQVLSTISEQVSRSAAPSARGGRTSKKEDFAQLRARISQCVENNDVDQLLQALALLADFPVNMIARLTTNTPGETLVALGKACGLSWADTQNIILVLRPELASAKGGIVALFDTYAAVSPADAQRAIQFIRTNTLRSTEKIRELARSGPEPAAAS